MELKNLNNATTLFVDENFKLLIDPWLVGDLYQNSWRPYPKQLVNKDWLKNINYIFISHLHQDHFDIETIKLINKDVKIILPNLKFNHVIFKKLSKFGYKNIEMKSIGKWHSINKDLKYYIVPPLNELAQEFDAYNKTKDEMLDLSIDTGIIISDKKSDTKHLILSDNSPYNLKSLKKHCGSLKINSFWFPYNGYASDYPLCYDNMTTSQKKKKSLKMSLQRENITLKAIKVIKPDYLVPHSSDFYLNGPRAKEFFKVHDRSFFDKDLFAKRIEKLTGIKSVALYSKDSLVFKKNNSQIQLRTQTIDKKKIPLNKKLFFYKIKKNKKSIKDNIENSVKAMFERAKRINIRLTKINDWIFKINLKKESFYIDLEKQKVTKKPNNGKKKILELTTSYQILNNIMFGKIHFDNAIIGNYLNWKRKPDVYNKTLYDLLCFFHLPR